MSDLPSAVNPDDTSDHDSPWKSAIEVFFQPCMELLFPQVASQLDWHHEPVFMDKELQKLTSDSSDSRRHVDKLIRVCTLSGEYRWILLHIEVQGEPETEFTRRMFTYYYRLVERFDEPVVSMAILTDTRKSFRPDHYRQELMGCSIRFDFICVKLLDLQPRLDAMLASDNIFALLVAAQLIAKQVKNPRQRTDAVLSFYRMARKKGYSRQHIFLMHDFIEWTPGNLAWYSTITQAARTRMPSSAGWCTDRRAGCSVIQVIPLSVDVFQHHISPCAFCRFAVAQPDQHGAAVVQYCQ